MSPLHAALRDGYRPRLVEHQVKTLVRTPRVRIDECSCGAVHLTMNGTTVRIDAGTSRELRDGLVHALAEIDRRVVKAPLPSALRVRDNDDDDPTVH